MPSFKELYTLLSDRFDLEQPRLRLDKHVVCHTFPFHSDMLFDKNTGRFGGREGKELFSAAADDDVLAGNISENQNFRYAVFVPEEQSSLGRPVILLHGLNERTWDKYLPWAYELAVSTRTPVILFPLAYHINRSPQRWHFPREMTKLVGERKRFYGLIGNSSFANVALSHRIDKDPSLFLSSGMQTLMDLVKLGQIIDAGNHPLFRANTGVDFFSYSIGALVTEILLMTNPLGLFSESKAFFFCGGATFDQMDGRSKSILDNRAFERLNQFISKASPPEITTQADPSLINSFWQAFVSMVSLDNFNARRPNILRQIGEKIRAIGLKIDKVVPGDAIRKTLSPGNKGDQVLVTDFNFGYSHESPFPLSPSVDQNEVEKAFKFVFRQASAFLGGSGFDHVKRNRQQYR